MLAETNRAPFDLPEAEAELVAGYHTEYSSMKFAIFFMGEYMNMMTISAVCATLFLGGWRGLFPIPFLAWLAGRRGLAHREGVGLMFFFLWVRWTFPRLRYDQLMAFGWKVLLPLALAQRGRDRARALLVDDSMTPLVFLLLAAMGLVGAVHGRPAEQPGRQRALPGARRS